MQKTRREVFDSEDDSYSERLEDWLKLPQKFGNDLLKCRVLYAEEIESVVFQPYQIRPIRSLKVVQNNSINYTYKTEDRSALTQLFQQRGTCEDIIIVKNDLVTDSYYANLVFDDGKRLLTPRRPLLKGVKRAKLLEAQVIQEADLRVEDFTQFERVHLVNAMMDLGECVVEMENIAL